ncbi:MAG TPA: hemolysin family protein [Polyangia bacterium]|nr:hemolysin family protein [Polyangia bacterium]
MLQFVFPHLATILGLLCLSAFFAASETAIFSLPRVAREALAAKSDRASQRVTALMAHPRRLIITIIVCNELVNILNSSVAASMTSHLLPQTRELVQIGISTAFMLPLILFFGEMLPKSLALRLGERFALPTSAILYWLAYLIAPLRIVLQTIASGVLTLVGAKPMTREEGLREEEFRALVDVGSEEGELQVAERRLIHNVFEFGDNTVGKVMTKADKVFALPYEMPLGRMVEQIARQRYSRVPVYSSVRGKPTRSADGKRTAQPSTREVVGILLAKELVGYAWGALEGHTVQDLLHPVLFVPRTTKCDQLFREFQRKRTHIALVVDEYGRLAGLATMEDLLEELFGEIADEKEGRP